MKHKKTEKKSAVKPDKELAALRKRVAELEAAEAERQRAEEALREGEENYRALIEKTNDTAYSANAEGIIEYVSPQVARYGFSPEALVSHSLLEFVHPEDRERVAADFQETVSAGREFLTEFRIEDKEGGVHWLEDYGKLRRDESGRIIGLSGVLRDVTDRKRAEEVLRASEDRFRDLVENIGDLVQILAPDGSFVYVNRAWRETLGYNEDEVHGMSVFDVIHPDSRAHCMGLFQRVVAGKTVRRVEAKFVSRDGRTIEVEGSANCHLVDGRPVAARAILRDVTERKRVEEALRESEERLRRLFETMAEGVILTAPDGQIVLANPAAERILGLKRSEIVARNYVAPEWEILRPDGTPMPPEEMPGPRAMKEKRLVRDVVMGVRRPDCSIAWANVSAAPVMTEAGGLSGVVGTFVDITDHKRAEEALRESEEKYRSIFESIRDVYAEVALDGTILEISPSIEEVGGYSREELLGKSLVGFYVRPEQRAELIDELRKTGEVNDYEVLLRHKDGRGVVCSYTVRLCTEADGKPTKIVGTMRDVTERKRGEEELRKAHDELERRVQERTAALLEARRDATVGRLAASVAHEVNNPLAAIKTQLSILKEDVSEAVPQATRNLGMVSGQVDRIARTVQSLLGFARQRSVAGKEVPLQELIHTVARLFEHAFRSKGIGFEVSLPENLPTIRGDADQLQGVFVNLLENARDLLETGRTVSIRAEVEQDEVEVCVEDNGPGLGEDPEKVLEPFYTTRPNGVGLGLSIAHRICRAHGGKLLPENRPAAEGGGARFRLVFPVAEGPEPSGGSDSAGKHEGTDR